MHYTQAHHTTSTFEIPPRQHKSKWRPTEGEQGAKKKKSKGQKKAKPAGKSTPLRGGDKAQKSTKKGRRHSRSMKAGMESAEAPKTHAHTKLHDSAGSAGNHETRRPDKADSVSRKRSEATREPTGSTAVEQQKTREVKEARAMAQKGTVTPQASASTPERQ